MTGKNKIYKRTFPVSWEQLHRDSRALAWRLLDRNDYFKGIVAITRGGLVPAAIIARELDIRLVDTVCVTSYDWQDHSGDVEVLKSLDIDGEGWLLIDDLVDTGKTAKIVRDMLPKAHFATVYAKAARPTTGRHVCHRGQPGHLDSVSLGYGEPVRRTNSFKYLAYCIPKQHFYSSSRSGKTWAFFNASSSF